MTTTAAEKIAKTQRGGTALKFNVAELRAAFAAVKDVVPARPSRPVLGNVLIVALRHHEGLGGCEVGSNVRDLFGEGEVMPRDLTQAP